MKRQEKTQERKPRGGTSRNSDQDKDKKKPAGKRPSSRPSQPRSGQSTWKNSEKKPAAPRGRDSDERKPVRQDRAEQQDRPARQGRPDRQDRPATRRDSSRTPAARQGRPVRQDRAPAARQDRAPATRQDRPVRQDRPIRQNRDERAPTRRPSSSYEDRRPSQPRERSEKRDFTIRDNPRSSFKFPTPDKRAESREHKVYRKPIEDVYHIYGKHAVRAFLETTNVSYGTLHLLDETGKNKDLEEIAEQATTKGFKVSKHSPETFPLPEDINHQRVALEVKDFPVSELETLGLPSGNRISIVVLDEIQDPRNFGAVLRNAAFFGVDAVIYQEHRQARLSPTVLKTSAGGAFAVKLVPVKNINRAIEWLKENQYWIIGTSLKTGDTVDTIPKDRGYALVLGNESHGMRETIEEKCDYTVQIKNSGNAKLVDSLNVSVACGIALHAFNA